MAHKYLVLDKKTLTLDPSENTFPDVSMAMAADPGNSDYHFLMAKLYARLAKDSKDQSIFYWDKTLSELMNAVKLNPLRIEYKESLRNTGEYYISRPDIGTSEKKALRSYLDRYL